jgi:hypothetical protein
VALMTSQELARACADEIVMQIGRSDTRVPVTEQIRALIAGAINRALDEQVRSISEIVHVYTPGLGAVDVKVTKSTQGVSLEVDCTRSREPGESWHDAAAASARLVAEAYSAAVEEIAAIGLVPGKESRT